MFKALLLFFSGCVVGGLVTQFRHSQPSVEQQQPSGELQPEAPVVAGSEQSVKIVEKIVYQCPEQPEDLKPQAPIFKKNLPTVLKTNNESEVRLAWENVPFATQYEVYMRSPKGKKIRSWKTARTSLYLKELPFQESLEFTPYTVSVAAINRKGILSEESATKELQVKRINSIVAPNIKSIVIED